MKLSVDLSIIQMLGEKLYSQGKALVFVKECLQNSLDANAHNILIEFENDGKFDYITITDDGDGIKDFQKYFATIGGSYKNKENAIGGFGIAKLAIMAMDDWYVTSIQGTLTKDILYNEREIDVNNTTNGTIVHGKMAFKYGTEKVIRRFLESCDVEANIFFNSEQLDRPNYEEFHFGDINVRGTLGVYNTIIVRLNGLTMFFSEFYVDSTGERYNYFYDVETALTPYDENYPLTATRESFKKGSQDYFDFESFSTRLRSLVEEAVNLEKMKHNEIKEYSPGLLVSGDVQYEQIMKGMKSFNLFKEQVIKILTLMELHPSDYKFVMSCDEPSFIAKYTPLHNAFSWNVNCMNKNLTKAEILETAIHEVTHIWEMNHYETFTMQQGVILRKVFEAIATKQLHI